MREILFRGKDIRGNWHIGLLARLGNAWYISNKADIATAYEVIPETVGQYTGLNDKNGTKIFEGDIIENCDFNAEEGGYGVIEYNDGAFEISGNYIIGATFHDSYWADHCGVIGNIHDNPELLWGGADNA